MAPALKDAWLMSTVCWKLARSFSAKFEVRLRQQRRDELRRDVERQRPLVVGNLRRRHRRLVLGRLQAMLALLAALEQVAETQVELRRCCPGSRW